MSAQSHVDDNYTFVGGLNTEGGYFVTPKNSWVEGKNVVPQIDGSVERRPAISLEEEGDALFVSSVLATDIINNVMSVNTWNSVGGDGNLDFFVVQVGSVVLLYKAYSGTVSARPVTGTLIIPEVFGPSSPSAQVSFSLSDFRAYGNTGLIYESEISVTSVYGNLLITHRDCEPILITYTKETNTYRLNKVQLKVRDLTGIASPVGDTKENTTAEWTALGFLAEAQYNLYNQGWNDERIAAYQAANAGKLPANTKQWFYGKDTNDDFDATVLAKVDFGSSTAPKGRFIVEAFNQDRAASLTQFLEEVNTTGSIISAPGNDGKGGAYYDFREIP